MAPFSLTSISLLSDDSQNTIAESDEANNVEMSKFRPEVDRFSQMQSDKTSADHAKSLKNMTGEHAWCVNPVEYGLPATASTDKKPSRSPQQYALHKKNWAWEVVNIGLLFVMVIATIVTLRLNDRQPVPDWPFSITINAMVSTYAFVFKGNVALILTSCIGQLQWSWYRSRHVLGDVALFQDAGRSPYGAFVWLCKLRLHQPIVALAALVTLLGVAIDPFFQQLAQSASCHAFSEAIPEPAIPRTNYINTAILSSKFNSSVSAGFYQPPNLLGLECSTGNCTFDAEYSTLAFCSRCEDISDQIEIEIHCPQRPEFDRTWSEDDFINCTHFGGCLLNNCSITTRVGTHLSATYINSTNNTFSQNTSQQRLTTNSEWRVNGQSLDDARSMLWNPGLSLGVNYGIIHGKSTGFVAPSISCEDGQTNNRWECRGYGAAKCSIQPCVRTYAGTIDSSQLHEKLIESTNDTLWGFSASVGTDGYPIAGLLDKQCISEHEHAHLVDEGYHLDGQGRWLAYNFGSQPPDEVTEIPTPFPDYFLLEKCAYGVDTGFLLNLFSTTLTEVLMGQVDYAGSGSTLSASQDVQGPEPLVYLYDSGNINMTNIDAAFQNVAETLTTWTRANGHQNYSHPAAGQAFHVVTCVYVNWEWLALPAVIALLAFLVLCLTVILTHREGLPLWKSSPLALLLHGPGGMDWLDEAMMAPPSKKGKQADLRTGAGIESMAARIWVRFEDGDAAPRLRQVGMRRKSEP